MVIQQKFANGKVSEQVTGTPLSVYRAMTPQALIVELRRITLEIKQTEKQMRSSARAVHSPKLRRICSALHREKRHIENELAERGNVPSNDTLESFLECVEIDLGQSATSQGVIHQLLFPEPDAAIITTLKEAHEHREKLNPGHDCLVATILQMQTV